MLSSSVSTSMRLPFASNDASTAASSRGEAISRSAMSRAPGWRGRRFSGSTQPSAETPVRITSIGCGGRRQRLQHRLHGRRHAAQRLAASSCSRPVRPRSAACRAPADRRSPRTRRPRRLEDVVAAVMQVVAGAADRAQRGVAGRHAGQGDRFLRLWRRRCSAHDRVLPSRPSRKCPTLRSSPARRAATRLSGPQFLRLQRRQPLRDIKETRRFGRLENSLGQC